jgi:hypothetical protein
MYRFLKQILFQIIALTLHFTYKRYFEKKECPVRRTICLTVRNDIEVAAEFLGFCECWNKIFYENKRNYVVIN